MEYGSTKAKLPYAYAKSKRKTDWLVVVAAIAIVAGMIIAFIVVFIIPFLGAYEEAKTVFPGSCGEALSAFVLIAMVLITIGFLSGILEKVFK